VFMEHRSRYCFEDHPAGCIITGADRQPTLITLTPNQTAITVVQSIDGSIPHAWRAPETLSLRFNPFAFHAILREAARTLMIPWEPRDTAAAPAIKQWVIDQATRALRYRLYGYWQQMIQQIPEPKQQVLRAVFAANFVHIDTDGGIECWDELYSGSYPRFLADIVQCRSAAIVCHHYPKLLRESDRFNTWVKRAAEREEAATVHRLIRDLAQLRVGVVCFDTTHPLKPSQEEVAANRQRLLQVLESDWRILFASRPDGFVSRPVCRTLAHWPGGLPAPLFSPLWKRPPAQVIETRLGYLLYALYLQEISPLEKDPWYARFFTSATPEEIRRAVRRFTRFLHLDYNTRSSTLYKFVRFLLDYCYAQPDGPSAKGNIVGLLAKSIKWHREQAAQENLLTEEERVKPFASPPIALPSSPAIMFLATQGALVDEGAQMLHCVGGKHYRDEALAGRSFFFHVAYRGEEATIQVNRSGQVAQAHGPKNYENKATYWGRRWLSAWGRAFPVPSEGEPSASSQEFDPFLDSDDLP
jgi:hypothetical protein